MDKNIYEKVCQIKGHHITIAQELAFDSATKTTLPITSKLCIQCGGTDDELAEAPRGFGLKTSRKPKNGETPDV